MYVNTPIFYVWCKKLILLSSEQIHPYIDEFLRNGTQDGWRESSLMKDGDRIVDNVLYSCPRSSKHQA